MVLGTQWYILFNVIAGASAMPRELRDAAEQFRRPGLAVVAQGGAARACFPTTSPARSPPRAARGTPASSPKSRAGARSTLRAHGLGAYIADATTAGDFHRIVLGIAVMSFFVVVVNRLFWRPLYWYAERKFRLT